MNTVWVMTSWTSSADVDGSPIIAIFPDFERGSIQAMRMVNGLKQDYFTHTEAEIEVETSFTDGLATYTINGRYGDNEFHPWDVIELRRYKLS